MYIDGVYAGRGRQYRSSFLDVERVDPMLSLRDSGSHIVLGNRMATQDEGRRAIVHDDRWLRRSDWLLPSLLLRPVMRYNARHVYGNIARPSSGS